MVLDHSLQKESVKFNAHGLLQIGNLIVSEHPCHRVPHMHLSINFAPSLHLFDLWSLRRFDLFGQFQDLGIGRIQERKV